MGAAHHFGVGRQGECAVIRADYAFFFQLCGNRGQAFQTALAHLGKQVLQRFVFNIEIQPDNMHTAVPPRYRNLHAVDKAHAQRRRFGARFGQAAGVVVVGEREQGAAVGMRQPHHFTRGQHAV